MKNHRQETSIMKLKLLFLLPSALLFIYLLNEFRLYTNFVPQVNLEILRYFINFYWLETIVFIILLAVGFYFYSSKGGINQNAFIENEILNESIKETEPFIIPDVCPHCKNPNTKKIRLCEWCGNQII